MATPGDSPKPCPIIYASFIQGTGSTEIRCALLFYQHGKSGRATLKRYHHDEQRNEVALEYCVYRSKFSCRTRDPGREIIGFFLPYANSNEFTLVFRDDHKDRYSLRHSKDKSSLQAALTGLSIHSSIDKCSLQFDRNGGFFCRLLCFRKEPIQIDNVQVQILTDRDVTQRTQPASRSPPSPLNMRISVTAAALSKLFLVYVSHNIEHTILDTLLTLKNVSVREIELIQGIPTNISVSASYDYKPNQEIRLKFSNTNDSHNFLSKFINVYDEWKTSREQTRKINQDLD